MMCIGSMSSASTVAAKARFERVAPAGGVAQLDAEAPRLGPRRLVVHRQEIHSGGVAHQFGHAIRRGHGAFSSISRPA